MDFKHWSKHKLCTFFPGIFFVLAAAVIFIILNLPTAGGGQTVRFDSSYKDNAVTLEASYFEAEDAEYAVLICPGYSCDRQKWRPMADLLVSNGFSAMTFDYAGQGASSDTIGFDNAKTDAIPVEIADAIEVLHELSGIDYENIILMGHSMGGRSILRLLSDYNNPDADTTVTARPVHNVILFSPEVNYNYNAQASLFAGTSDDEDEPWHSYNAAYTAGVNIYLYGSTADDIVSDEDILDIYRHLIYSEEDPAGSEALQAASASDDAAYGLRADADSGTYAGSGAVPESGTYAASGSIPESDTYAASGTIPESGTYAGSVINPAGSKITVGITSGVLHSYEMYSPKFVRFTNEALADIVNSAAGTTSEASSAASTADMYAPVHFAFIYVGWFAALLGLLLVLIGLNTDLEWKGRKDVPVLLDERAFLKHKLLLWLPAVPIAFIICCLCVCMPFGSPVMNTPYMCFIAGYGIMMLIAYRKGSFKGTEGRLPRPGFLKGRQAGDRPRTGESNDVQVSGCLSTGNSNASRDFGCSNASPHSGHSNATQNSGHPNASQNSGHSNALSFACSRGTIPTVCAICIVLCLFVWFVLRSSMYRLIPVNARLFWVIFAAVLMAIGYYVSGCETDMLQNAGASRRTIVLYNLIQYVALFLLVLFYMIIKSYSGMIGQAQNMLLMYIFCIPLGNYVRKKTGSRIAGAVLSAFLFQTLMITSAALIAMF